MKTSKHVIDIDKGWKKIQREMLRGHGTELIVGVPQGATNGEGTTIAEYATYNEFGTSKIPSRPFMRTAFDKNKNKYIKLMQNVMDSIVQPTGTFYNAVNKLGLIAQTDIQNTIVAIKTPPNSPKTIALKGSSNPLIDTGAMKASISYTLRKYRR